MGLIAIDAELARRALSLARTMRVRVTGDSMGPWIRSGDIVELEGVDPRRVRRGEVLVFERHGSLIAHRAVRRIEHGWITRGDARGAYDPVVDDSAVVGRVVGLHLRWITLAAPDPRVSNFVGRVLLRASPWWARVARKLVAT